MTSHPSRFVALLVAICFLGGTLSAFANSPNLNSAFECLKVAKTSDDPVPHLKEAIKWLKRATNDKGGKRDAAIGLINDAIALENAGDKDGANQKIDHASAGIYAAAHHVGGWD
jgi:hypothetical protein